MKNRFVINTSERYSAALTYKWARGCELSRKDAFLCACVRHAWTGKLADVYYEQLSKSAKRVVVHA